jgi:DNA polymerase-3 subunit beta
MKPTTFGSKISKSQNQMVFEVGQTTLTSRLIEGRFPNYEQVIPKEERTTTEINRQELLSAVRRVSLLAPHENQSVKFDFTGSRLLVSSRSPNLGEAKEELDVKISGEELSIGFNPNYLIDVLKNLDTERISISMTDPDKPGTVKNGGDYLYVVMPMQLS